MVATTENRERLPAQVRLLGMACFALPVTALYVVFVYWRTGEFPGGNWWSPILSVPVIGVVGAWVWRYGPGRLVGDVFGHLGWMAVGLWFPEDALISHEDLRATMDSITLPPTFRRTDEKAEWSRWGGKYSSYTRHWVAAGEGATVLAELRAAAGSRGFVLGTWRTDPAEPVIATAEAVKDRLKLVVHVDAHRAFDDGRHRQLSPGNFGVTAVLQKH